MNAVWRRNLEHDGIEVSFPSRPSPEIIAGLKSHGFRWSGRSRVWYAKDTPWRRQYLDTIAVQVEDVGERLTYAERKEREAERAEARRERYDARAEKAEAAGRARFRAADQIASYIPPGQPILVGHHSERRHRRDVARIDNNMRRGIERMEAAKEYRYKAVAIGHNLERQNRPDFIAQRIKEAEADIRKLERDGERNPVWGASAQWQELRREATEKLTYWRERLEEAGGVKFGPHNVRKGDQILGPHGPAVVVRVNRLSVTVDYMAEYLGVLGKGCKVEFERIKAVRRPEQERVTDA